MNGELTLDIQTDIAKWIISRWMVPTCRYVPNGKFRTRVATFQRHVRRKLVHDVCADNNANE